MCVSYRERVRRDDRKDAKIRSIAWLGITENGLLSH
jgi:hypothetical protein